ncbi:hypothetical protein GOV14_03125 [Candidatus Pacearchaeota archaeon]|nr:hypothetical protein [Candidatus Pacearchaeota archaeon]
MVILTPKNIKKYDLEGMRQRLGLQIGDELYINDAYIHPENYLSRDDEKQIKAYFSKKKQRLENIATQIKNIKDSK